MAYQGMRVLNFELNKFELFEQRFSQLKTASVKDNQRTGTSCKSAAAFKYEQQPLSTNTTRESSLLFQERVVAFKYMKDNL